MSETPADIEKLSYEDAFSEVEEIVAQLEGDTLSLEKSLSLFERGKTLVNHCSTLLEHADLKVRQLSHQDDGLNDFQEIDYIEDEDEE